MKAGRRLAGLGLGFLAASLLGALGVRALAPPSVLAFGFQLDPAVALLASGLLLAAVPLGIAAALAAWQRSLRGELERQRVELELERRRFLRRLDHELKNPLTAIQVQLDNLPEVSGIAGVRLQANRLANLTRGLRRLADLETQPLELESIDVGELMDEIVEFLQTPERIDLDVQRLPWPVPPIVADRELLLLALGNVVSNALNYSAGTVQVRVSHTSGHLVIEVVDTGSGIEPKDLPHVTEELFRGANVHDLPGSGLGLSIVQRVIDRHRGQLELLSRPGKGTIVTVRLPYDQKSPA